MKFPFFKKMQLPPLTIFEQTFIKEHPNYRLIDIDTGYWDIIKTAHTYFITKTEVDKEYLLKNLFEECKKVYHDELVKSNLLDIETFEYIVLSREDIDKRYLGNLYFAELDN